MKRVSLKSLQSRVMTLNTILERPLDQFSSKLGEPCKFSIGHITVASNGHGYYLEEQVSDSGGVTMLEEGLTAGEMNLFLTGLIHGVGLGSRHLGEKVLRHELSKAGLCASDVPLYQEDAARDLLVGQYRAMTTVSRQLAIRSYTKE